MNIRHANPADLDRIMEIYARAQQFMRESGNPTQWSNVYPTRGLIEDDIARQISYVVTDDTEKVQGVFVFVIGKDRTYAVIRGGAWKNDDPYGTIHRMGLSATYASKQIKAYTGTNVVNYINNLRIDTHENNRVMQHLITKSGFTFCGHITADDGTDRLAYQYTK